MLLPYEKAQRRQRIKSVRDFLLFTITAFAAGFAITLLSVRAIEIESAWKAERLCRIYGVCPDRAGK